MIDKINKTSVSFSLCPDVVFQRASLRNQGFPLLLRIVAKFVVWKEFRVLIFLRQPASWVITSHHVVLKQYYFGSSLTEWLHTPSLTKLGFKPMTSRPSTVHLMSMNHQIACMKYFTIIDIFCVLCFICLVLYCVLHVFQVLVSLYPPKVYCVELDQWDCLSLCGVSEDLSPWWVRPTSSFSNSSV